MPRATCQPLSVRHYGAAPGGHAHGHFQVLLTLTGRLELDIEGRGIVLDAGQGLVLRPGERHDFESRRGSSCLVLDTNESSWAAAPRAPQRPQTVYRLARFLEAALCDGLTFARTIGPELLARAWAPAPQDPRRVRRQVDWVALGHWVESRMNQPLTTALIAEHVHLSESQFRARCLEELGLSPMQWVRERRCARAAALRAAGLSAAEAARQSGYLSPSALTAAMNRIRTSVPRR